MSELRIGFIGLGNMGGRMVTNLQKAGYTANPLEDGSLSSYRVVRVPITTLNLDRVKLRLVRVNERSLVPSINAEKLTMSFGADDVDEVINQTGSLVWHGEMTISGRRKPRP